MGGANVQKDESHLSSSTIASHRAKLLPWGRNIARFHFRLRPADRKPWRLPDAEESVVVVDQPSKKRDECMAATKRREREKKKEGGEEGQ